MVINSVSISRTFDIFSDYKAIVCLFICECQVPVTNDENVINSALHSPRHLYICKHQILVIKYISNFVYCTCLYIYEHWDHVTNDNKRPKGPHIVHMSTMCHLFDRLARVAILFFRSAQKTQTCYRSWDLAACQVS